MALVAFIIQRLLGLIFVVTGSFKLFQSREKVIASGGTWAEDFKPRTVKIIAAVELISGLLVMIFSWGYFTFLGALSIAIIMTGSIYVHIKRKEYRHAGINSVFLLIALFVAFILIPPGLINGH